MGLGTKVLGGVGHASAAVGKFAWKHDTMDNLPPLDGGGLSAAIIPKQINFKGFMTLSAVGAVVGIAKESLAAHNRITMGSVRYQDGLDCMTSSFTSGAVPAMMRGSKGDYQAFAGMAKKVVSSPGLGRIDDFGANPAMISALYNMGGR